MRQNLLVIAHRGYSTQYPECTELAYRKAIELGVDFIELDVMRSQDGHFMVFHASNLSDVSNAKGRITDYTFEELRRINITARFGDQFGFQKIPTLEEILILAKESGVRLCVEMKDLESQDIPGYEDLIVPFFVKHGLIGRAVFNSVNDNFLRACHQKYPEIPTAIDFGGNKWTGNLDSFIQRALRLGAQIIQYDYRGMSPEIVHALKCQGFAIWAWTINKREDMLRAIEWGVDGILTDDPATLCEIIGCAKSW